MLTTERPTKFALDSNSQIRTRFEKECHLLFSPFFFFSLVCCQRKAVQRVRHLVIDLRRQAQQCTLRPSAIVQKTLKQSGCVVA